MQVLTSVAQVADSIAPVKRTKPLNVVADSRGLNLEEFVDRLHTRRAKTSSLDPDKMLLTTDILPTEALSAGVQSCCKLLCIPILVPMHSTVVVRKVRHVTRHKAPRR